jgi:hypothetical protein
LVHREIYFKPKNSKATLPAQITFPVSFMADTEVDVMDFEMEEVDLMVEDTKMDDGNAETLPTLVPKLKSNITSRTSQLSDGSPDKTKRSFRKENNVECNSIFEARN